MLAVESLYSSLYKKPLYELIYSKGKKKSLDIFILGDNNADALLCFKSVFWCGQLSFHGFEYEFNITIVCENPNGVKSEYLDSMPALFEYKLANIRFAKKINSYSETIGRICRNNACVFNCTSESLELSSLNADSRLRVYEINNNALLGNNNVETVIMGDTEESELNELAFGVHFNYKRSFDPYADKKAERNVFFLEGNEYNRNSSLAAALHIRYKLYSVGVNWFDSDNADEMAATLDGISKIINQKGKTYDELVLIEHNRWMAYMISSGFTAPTDEELEGYAFNYYEYDGKKGFIKSFKNAAYPPYKHPCIVPCSNGVVLNRLRKKEWDNLSEADIANLDELDKVSVKLHRIAEKKSAEYYSEIFAILDRLSEVTIIFDEVANLKIIVEMLYNKNLRAETLLNKNIKKIKAKIANNDKIIERVNTLNDLLEVVKERNIYHDYKKSDSDFIDMLPYIIYSVNPYRCFIKFYSPDIVSNVTSISTILPDRIVFWGIDSDDANFMSNTKNFLLNRHIIDENSHQNKELVFYKYHAGDVENVCRKFDDFLKKYNIEADDCIIDITDASPNLCTAAGVISSANNIPVIRFDLNKGIQPVMNEGKLCFSTNIPKASIDELYTLLNCKELFRISHDDALSLKEVMIKLYSIFEEYKDVWTNSITAIQKLKSDVIIFQRTASYIKANKNNSIKHYCDSVSAVSFNGKRLDKFLSNAEKLGIIDSLHVKANGDNSYIVEFDCYDQVIIDKVIKNDEHYPITIRISGADLKFIQHSLKVRNILIPDDFPSDALEILEKANKFQLVKNFRIESIGSENYINFEFANNLVKKCLTIDGAALELLVYYTAAFESNFFDDVKNNFVFLWDCNTSNSVVESENRKFTGISDFKPVLSNTAFECVKNEIDLILVKKFRLKIISCKAGKVKQLDLMQIKYLSEFFGKYGKAILAYSNDGINKETQTRTLDPVLKRAAEMQIDCICPSDIFGKKNELIEKLKKGI